MSFKLKIKDYQIIEDSSYEFIEGLNIVIGCSNSGKTAMLRAIDGVIFNKSSDDKIRFGKTSSLVGIDYNGNKVLWKRDKSAESKVSYSVNGKVLVKVGRVQPQEVKDALGISEIVMLKSKEKLNFWRQMDYPLLLEKTPSQLYEFMALSSEEDNLTACLSLMKEDLKTTNDNLKRAEGALDVINTNLTEDKNKYLNKVQALDTIEDILTLDNKIKELELFTSDFTNCVNLYNMVYKESKNYNSISDRLDLVLEDIETCSIIYNTLTSLDSMVKDITTLESKIKAVDYSLTRINNIFDNSNILDMDISVTKVKSLDNNISNIDNLITSIDDLLSKIETTQSKLDKSDVIIKDFEVLEITYRKLINVLQDIDGLTNIITSINNLVNTLDNIEDISISLDREISNNIEQLKEFKYCPVCERPL